VSAEVGVRRIFLWGRYSLNHTPSILVLKVVSASPVLSRFTTSFTCQPICLNIPDLIIHHSFTLLLQTQNLPFQQILPTLDFFYLLKVLADDYVAADAGNVTLLSLLDLSAAFDTVDHSILMERLRRSNGVVDARWTG